MPEPQSTGAWIVERSWGPEAEDEFARWVEQLGRASSQHRGKKLGPCLADPSINALHTANDALPRVFADCADLPMVLRAWFAWRTRRPFQFVSGVIGERYTPDNRPRAWRDHTQFPSLAALVSSMVRAVHSGFYRTAPELEGTDTYPVDVTPETVRPGSVFYDPNGHVLMVYAVEESGLVRLMDGHPDNSLTHTVFGEKFARGGAKQGGGFRAWRGYRVDGAGGTARFVRTPNSELRGFSATAQYARSYDLGGRAGTYCDWVRSRLARAGARVDPVHEFRELVETFARELGDRVTAVQGAVSAGLPAQPHPPALPANVYSTTGDWETWATCSRDARLRASVRGMHRLVSDAVSSARARDGRYAFAGGERELAAALTEAWRAVATSAAGRVTYTDSAGTARRLTLDEVVKRLFALSFDPYHSAELRWGARPAREGRPADRDYANARDDAEKLKWYWDEQRLRNVVDRLESATTPLDAGPVQAPDVDVVALLRSLSAATPG